MTAAKPFEVKFLHTEKHFLLPTVRSIVVAQNLYEILFQYVISPEREAMLKLFLSKLEAHIKSKPRAPFSIPYTELEFLEEGIEELRLLNWIELDVAVCEIIVDGDEEVFETILQILEDYLIFNRVPDSSTLYIYPSGLTRF